MLLKISDEAFKAYLNRLYDAVSKATFEDLIRLQPSVIMVQRQAKNSDRTWRVLHLLRHYNAVYKRITDGKHSATS